MNHGACYPLPKNLVPIQQCNGYTLVPLMVEFGVGQIYIEFELHSAVYHETMTTPQTVGPRIPY